MNFLFEEEEQQLADSLSKAIERDYEFEARKKIIASSTGHSEPMWKAMAEMGIVLLPMSERAGGFGMGCLALFPIMEQVGRGLLVEPLVETLLCARLLDRIGGAKQADLLASIGAAEAKIAFAHLESNASPDARDITTMAVRTGDGWALHGRKQMVIVADSADKILVTARTDAGGGEATVGLFLVDVQAAGLKRESLRTVDSHRAADVSFDNCPAQPLGEPDEALEALDEALDFATLLVCAEAVGAMSFANETTLEYLKTRQQFGTPIGAFQALQHRMVDMTVCAEQSRSITYLASDALDKAALDMTADNIRNRRHLVSAAKVKVSDAARQVGEESIQLHGGMGMTNEMKVSHTFKRLTMIANSFGDVDYHLERFAATAR